MASNQGDNGPTPVELKRLVNKRNSSSKAMSVIKKYLERFDPRVHSYNHLEVRLTKLEEHMQLFEEYQGEIELVDDVGESMLEERAVVENEYCDIKATLLELIGKHKPAIAESAQSSAPTIVRDSMKLPSIPAPSFDGNLQNWVSFLDTFNAMFHFNTGLSDVQRLHYLKSCLTGSAAEVVRAIPTTEENYRMAYDAMVERYENKSLIIQSHIRSLFQTHEVQQPSAYELRQLHQHIVSHYRALKALKQPVEQWDAWLVTLICCKLDSNTVGEWQLSLKSKELPTFQEIEAFLASRVSAYEVGEIDKSTASTISTSKSISNITKPSHKKVFLVNQNSSKPSLTIKCPLCSGAHRLYFCDDFLKKTVDERRKVVSDAALCFNCFLHGHQASQCRLGACKKCGRKHNTKIHVDQVHSNDVDQSPGAVLYAQKHLKTHQTNYPTYAMLATSIVYINNAQGDPQPCRAVLDAGAQLNFMTQACANKLQLKGNGQSATIAGIGANVMNAKGLAPVTMSSRFHNYHSQITFHVLPTISNKLPSQYLNTNKFDMPRDIQAQLADPQFYQPGEIDCLIGADTFYEVFNGSQVQISPNLTARSTKLGWVITGKMVESTHIISASTLSAVTNQSALALCITKSTVRRQEENAAEEHFISTFQRNETGRFIVRLPLKRNPNELGDSRAMAMKRFFHLERRLAKDHALAKEYKAFMREYVELGHMKKVNVASKEPSYYLPHHAVVKADSMTTKVRVVFDGSAPSTSGLSLNDILHRGPKIQADIFEIILRFRIHATVITADVAKMYRQVYVHPSDHDLQRICYRESPDEPLQDFQLCTVTYGTKSASFLATRCLVQLGQEVTSPSIKRTLLEDFYVDDLISGASNDNDCYLLYQELSAVLDSAGFPLRKWCSNSPSLMAQIPTALNDPTYRLALTDQDTVSALGLLWQPKSDTFQFTINNSDSSSQVTKRTLLAYINRIYDPVGFLTPALIRGKIFVQQLWSLKLDWDSILPIDLQSRWFKFNTGLKVLENLVIPRRAVIGSPSQISAHGFCDASQDAYGACVYIRSHLGPGKSSVRLFVSKSRVAPMHSTTIPRLELCGALLLAELIADVTTELARIGVHLQPSDITLWTDSTIVLGWIKSDVQLKTFAANRVAQIHDLTQNNQWRHVPTADNPADLISRGVAPETLLSLDSLWWRGPQWLQADEDLWPNLPLPYEELPEIRPLKLALISNVQKSDLLEFHSDWIRLTRITAWILRFKHNTMIPNARSTERILSHLTVSEVRSAEKLWIRHAQAVSFEREIKDLTTHKQVSSKSSLKLLNPFICSENLIRVHGRLARSMLPDDRKFPIILPAHNKVSSMIFEYEHKRLLHAGPQALLSSIHLRFWPLRGRDLAKSTVHKCHTCFRFRPKFLNQIMAPLPRERTMVQRPFTCTGVDFCGPINVRSGIRRVTSVKAYISVFVCFSTRAIHLELVHGLTTAAFLAALKRFIARRGCCSQMFSDNGTNFVGADKELKSYLKKLQCQKEIHDDLTSLGIHWQFIPPSAPHFGGLWESAVKSTKTHLLKVTKGALLTYEELNTLLCQIEAILNSRPMVALSDDPSDYNVLTPSHFLIGAPLTQIPEPIALVEPKNRLKRWELVRYQAQSFWARWSKEYLPQFHKRGKWFTSTRSPQIGDIAILKEDNLIPLNWKLVRITAVHEGQDGHVRVVTVRTANGVEYRRPIVKLALIPTAKEEAEPYP